MESTAGIIATLEQWDKTATLALNSLHCGFTDWMWQVFSDKYIWVPLYVAVLIMLFFRLGWKKALIVFFACVLTVLACDQFANFTKAYFERLRPCWDVEMVNAGLRLLEGKGNRYGFYSAHAANAAGFAMCSAWLLRRLDTRQKYRGYAWGIAVWAFLVGASRIFVGKHFLGDVLTGLAVGVLFAWLIALLAREVAKKV